MNNQEAIEVMFNEWKCIDRNDGINCDRKCESCDLVMDVQTIREAFNMAISALQAQEAKTQLSAEGTTSDLISRQDAIDALMDFDKKLRKINWYQYPHTEYECRGVDEAIVKIENVPSAQPDNRLEKIADLMEGTIDHFDRDDAMDLLYQIKEVFK